MEFNELIQAFAASLGLDGVEIEGGAAAFEIDGMKVNIFNDAEADTVMVYGEIGQPPSEDDRSFGPAMLKANHLFGGTGGATFCQDPETGAYAIFQVFPSRGLTPNCLPPRWRASSIRRSSGAASSTPSRSRSTKRAPPPPRKCWSMPSTADTEASSRSESQTKM